VTGTEIRIAVDDVIFKYDTQAASDDLAALMEFFNAHFQLYGRKLRLVFYHSEDSGPYLEGDPRNQANAAKSAAAQAPFAATDFWDSTSSAKIFWTQLAKSHVISTAAAVIGSSSSEYDKLSPYVWTYGMPYDALERNMAAFICDSLPASAPAAYAGSDVQGKPRKFAVVVPYTDGTIPTPDTQPLRQGLASCGVRADVIQLPDSGSDRTESSVELAFQRMHQDGYTTLMPFGYSGQVRGMPEYANKVGYQPEWIINGAPFLQGDYLWQTDSPTQLSHLLGLASWNKNLPLADQPWYIAYRSVRPKSPRAYAGSIQMAGSGLTPQSFASGLRSTTFPNPGGAAAPWYQASVGFQSHPWMQQDLAAWSWSSTTPSRSPGSQRAPGATCNVYLGKRWALETGWPKGPLPFFDPNAPCY
jgi:hypothetical protein